MAITGSPLAMINGTARRASGVAARKTLAVAVLAQEGQQLLDLLCAGAPDHRVFRRRRLPQTGGGELDVTGDDDAAQGPGRRQD
jgi:hypothetical protein